MPLIEGKKICSIGGRRLVNNKKLKEDFMNIYAVPIEHFVLDGVKKLGKYILMPIDYILMDGCSFDLNMSDIDKKVMDYIITEQMDILIKFGELQYCTLAVCIVDKIDDMTSMQLTHICFDLEKALDYIAITQYRFDRKEWTIGIPGSISVAKVGCIMNTTDNTVEFCTINMHSFCEIPGIGLEISFQTLKEMDEELYSIIFSERKDEVYCVCRNYIAKACRAFYLTDLNGVFLHLFSVLEGIGMVGSQSFLRFTLENERIMSFLSFSQQEYEQRLDEFCYYSETLRTLVVHHGKDILEFIDIKSAFRLLTTIFWVVIQYAVTLIKLNITDFVALEKRINEQIDHFEKHVSHLETFVFKMDTFNCEGERDIFIVPVENFKLEEVLVYKNMVIVPKQYNYCECNISQSGIEEHVFWHIMNNKDIIRLNEHVTLILYKGVYRLNNINMSETAWQYLDDVCSKIKDELIFLYLNNCKIKGRDGLFGAVGIYNGTRIGILYDKAFDKFYPLLGRVYSIYNNTENSFIYDKGKVEQWIYKATLGNERKDIIALDCKSAIQGIGKAIYVDDINYAFIYLFDAIERLYSCEYKTALKWKWIAGFLMKKRSEYDMIHDRLVEIGEKYRTPIFHYGKNIYEVINDDEQIYILFDELKQIILEYCREVLSTGIVTYEELNEERINRMNVR